MYNTQTYKGKKIHYVDSADLNYPITVLSSSSTLATLSSLKYDIDTSIYKEVARVNCSLFENDPKKSNFGEHYGWEYSDVFKTTSTSEHVDVIQFKDGTYKFGHINPKEVATDDINWAYSGSHIILQNGQDVLLYPSWRKKYTEGQYCWSFFATRNNGTFVVGALDSNHVIGVTDLRNFLKSLDCTNAIVNDGGGSAELIVDGKVVNRAKSTERKIANGLFVYEEIKSQSTPSKEDGATQLLRQIGNLINNYFKE